MAEYTMGEMEMRFARIIWEREPVSSGELVEIARDKLGWKKSTTYTVLRRLCERGIFRNEKSVVTSVLSEQDFMARQSEEMVAAGFGGSLPAFVAAFAMRRKLSAEDKKELIRIVENM